MLFRHYYCIKIYMYTWKCREQTGTNRWKWMRMGADGCVGAQGARGIRKTSNRGDFRVVQVRIWDLWPEKILQTWRFVRVVKMVKYGCRWMQMGCNAWIWMNIQQSRQKTRQNPHKLVIRTWFYTVWSQQENIKLAGIVSVCSQGIMERNWGETQGLR